jgi:SAM-dependent methyltransferase
MNDFDYGVARAVAQSFDFQGPILEVGSYQVTGQADIANLRALFPGREYLGVDARPGPGVDEIANVEDLPYADASFGTVIAMNTFEHVPHFWRGFEEVYRVLRPDGALLICCPFFFHIHSHPSDYWRFTPQAFDLLLSEYPTRILGWHGPRNRPAGVWALAFREQAPELSQQHFECYRTLLRQYARQPMKWSRRMRYQLGQLFFGPRPFAPFLEHDYWETDLITCKSRASQSVA